jgi:hypothetical protein
MNNSLIDQTKIYNLDIKNIPIYIINLLEHTEKYDKLYNSLSNNNFTKIYRFDAIKDKNPVVGCAKSHMAVLSQNKNIDTPYIVLEDDCILNSDDTNISVPEDADALYLGISRYGYLDYKLNILDSKASAHHMMHQKTDIPHIHKIYNMLASHAVLYTSKEYVIRIIRICNFFINLKDHFDKGLAENMKYYNVYALEKPIFHQAGPSSLLATKFNLSDIAEKTYY